VATFAARALSRGIRLEILMPMDFRAAGDAIGVDRVLTNLIDNALKYCPENVKITIEAHEVGDKIQILVKDSGPGIDNRHLPRLFERFYRVDPGRSREMGGTGLGLSIVKHLVEAMGGEVLVESTPGKGSTFGFTLPRSA
jgi:two-component system phosphate regulon sensor histidine kinase PhoR